MENNIYTVKSGKGRKPVQVKHFDVLEVRYVVSDVTGNKTSWLHFVTIKSQYEAERAVTLTLKGCANRPDSEYRIARMGLDRGIVLAK
jgi:hypothetical protein